MGEKKLKISDVASATGINRGTLTRLYKETATRIDIDVIDKLCDFFECEVADLFEHIANNDN
jgi:putative transcriptional regulator